MAKTLPYPEINDDEKHIILIMRRHPEKFSYEDIARTLNRFFPEYNHECRTRDGIYRYVSKTLESRVEPIYTPC